MFRTILRILLLVALYFSAPRPSFWHDVSMLDDPTAQEIADEECDRILKSIPTHYAETYTEFYCNPSTGSNLNGGSDSGSPSMSDTSNTGSWTSTTNVYVSTATTGTVTVGQFASIYSSGATVAAYTARITTVTGGSGSAWTITLSSTAISGAKPSTASTYNMQVGGVWKGPNGAIEFPFNYIANALKDATGHVPRVNLLNAATYSITAAMTQGTIGLVVFQGYSSSTGDLGRATIDGGTSGASYTLLAVSSNCEFRDIIFQNNGATGSSACVSCSGGGAGFLRCVFNNTRGSGISAISQINLMECEAYDCNQSNLANSGAFGNSSTGGAFSCFYCVAHDNSGSNTFGFYCTLGTTCVNCIADTNGGSGFGTNTSGSAINLLACVSYNNGGSGFAPAQNTCRAMNCIFSSNAAFGISGINTNIFQLTVFNCAFYSNTSGQINGLAITDTGTITLTSDPFNDAAHGDFSLNNTAGAGAACRAAGFGSFTQTNRYTKTTTSFPDVGAAQVADTGGSAGILVTGGMTGGLRG